MSLPMPTGFSITPYSCWRRQPSNCQLCDSSVFPWGCMLLKMKTSTNWVKTYTLYSSPCHWWLWRLCISCIPTTGNIPQPAICWALFCLIWAVQCSVFKPTFNICWYKSQRIGTAIMKWYYKSPVLWINSGFNLILGDDQSQNSTNEIISTLAA